MKPITHYAIIGDKSGSMANRRQEFVTHYNEQVQQLKLDAEVGDQELLCSLFTFNGETNEHIWEQPAIELQEATVEQYNPKGGTAMRDAIAYVIHRYKESTDYKNPNHAYCLYIITDGESFNDKHYSHHDKAALDRFKKLVQECEATSRWTFTLLGCSKEYLYQLSQQTGISPSNMAQFSVQSAESFNYASRETANRTRRYLRARAGGQCATTNYMSDSADVACFVPPAGNVSIGDIPVNADLQYPKKVDNSVWSNVLRTSNDYVWNKQAG